MVAIFPGSLPFMKSLNELSPPLGAPMAFTLGPRDKAMTDPEPSRFRSSVFHALSPASQPTLLLLPSPRGSHV